MKYPYGILPLSLPEGWGKPAKVSHLTKEYNGIKHVIGIKVEKNDGDKFVIPIVNVTLSDKHRDRAESMLKDHRTQQGSKFIHTSYSLMGFRYN